MSADKSIDREAIRAMVRQVLRDALPEAVREKVAAQAADAAAPKKKAETRPAQSETSKTEEVAITTDVELAAFVRRVIEQREAIQAGRLKFRLKGARKSAAADAGAPRGGSERIDKGIVTEKKVMAAAKAGKRLVVGKGVVLTPLARDKARQLGVEIERD
jgi:hypothetical protein